MTTMPTLRLVLLAALASISLFGMLACGSIDQDMQSLIRFKIAYEQFDQRASDFSGRATESNEHAADKALAELTTRASIHLSSFIKNDGAMLRVVHQVSDAATVELVTLKKYSRSAAERHDDSPAL